jgi:hypothetical protein
MPSKQYIYSQIWPAWAHGLLFLHQDLLSFPGVNKVCLQNLGPAPQYSSPCLAYWLIGKTLFLILIHVPENTILCIFFHVGHTLRSVNQVFLLFNCFWFRIFPHIQQKCPGCWSVYGLEYKIPIALGKKGNILYSNSAYRYMNKIF